MTAHLVLGVIQLADDLGPGGGSGVFHLHDVGDGGLASISRGSSRVPGQSQRVAAQRSDAR